MCLFCVCGLLFREKCLNTQKNMGNAAVVFFLGGFQLYADLQIVNSLMFIEMML